MKHQRCILIMGHDFPLTADELLDWGDLSGYSYWMQQGRAVSGLQCGILFNEMIC